MKDVSIHQNKKYNLFKEDVQHVLVCKLSGGGMSSSAIVYVYE